MFLFSIFPLGGFAPMADVSALGVWCWTTWPSRPCIEVNVGLMPLRNWNGNLVLTVCYRLFLGFSWWFLKLIAICWRLKWMGTCPSVEIDSRSKKKGLSYSIRYFWKAVEISVVSRFAGPSGGQDPKRQFATWRGDLLCSHLCMRHGGEVAACFDSVPWQFDRSFVHHQSFFWGDGVVFIVMFLFFCELSTHSSRLLEAPKRNAVVLSAAMNCCQGHWQQALQLLDDAKNGSIQQVAGLGCCWICWDMF